MTKRKSKSLNISPEAQERIEQWKNRQIDPAAWEFIAPHIRRDVGQIIRNAREAKKFSQQELADKLGTRQAYISDLEKGKTEPNVTLLFQLSYYLEQPVMFFIPPEYRDNFGVHPVHREEL